MVKAKQRAKPARSEAPSPGAGQAAPRSFPIVGIGASAGGLEAFRRLLGALPTSTGMAFVLVQHLDPNHASILAELLSEVTRMDVAEVTGDLQVAPNHVYVIPPSNGLILQDGMLKLVPRGPPGPAPMAIDSFFKSLAEVQGSQAIGVILSGMGSDGTVGLQAIEAAGGIAIAQEPGSAQNPEMPKSAIAAGGVDFVLTPEDIASELKRLGQHPYVVSGVDTEPAPAPTGEAEGRELEGLSRVLELLHDVGGTDFSAYKKTTLRRRIARRMAVSRIDSLPEYARFLEGNPTETAALYQDCLISVTSFFRDPEVFDLLREQILPRLLRDRAADAPLRLWVPGCATGEEAYSLAMSVVECSEATGSLSLQVFATDLSEAALAKARDGTYPLSIAGEVSPQRLRRFFTQVGDCYQISKSIREMCVFARHDLTRDPPYSRLDLISCRNLLIYLEPRLQELVFATLHYALNPDGVLVLGAAESVGSTSALFTLVDEKHRIYSRKAVTGPPRLLAVRATAQPVRSGVEQLRRRRGAAEAPREADRMLLARFGPAAVVIDEGMNVLEFRGDTAPFLDHGRGKASLSLERLVRKGLMLELRRAVAESRKTDAPVRKDGLFVRSEQQLQKVSVEVLPIAGPAVAERCQLVIFQLAGGPISVESNVDGALTPVGDTRDLEIERLGHGLEQTTEYVHTLVREHESALEELQSTAEEALSSNEELQSLNEELQTAKEEIQSANEELATLNQELQDRNVDLARSNRDIQRGLDSANQLVDTVPGALVILDAELRVEKANAAFYEIFQTQPERARGRFLAELGARDWDQPELLASLRDVLLSGATLQERPLAVELPGVGARSLSLNARRLHPDRDAQARLLLAFDDRTEAKRIEHDREQLLALEREARSKAEAADQLKDQFVATASHELRGPLTVISAWMSVLLEAGADIDSATLTKALTAIQRAVTAQGRLVSDLLEHAQICAGKLELQTAPVDLLPVATAAMVGVKAAANAKDIDLQLNHDGAPCIVVGDADRLQQVLWNLLSNAVKFTPWRGAVRIQLGRNGNRAKVVVTDSGCGISAALLPHVFERFRQAEGTGAGSRPGLGLGLTLVKELVEMHGGSVRVESEGPDRGATFTVDLPIPAVFSADFVPAPARASSVPKADVPQPRAENTMRPGPLLRGTRVLVVDDEADAREALVALLEIHGAVVRSVGSAAEAIAELRSSVPDVVTTDISMPGADGHELLRLIRMLPSDAGGRLPVLALSGYVGDTRSAKRMVGFQGSLQKPVPAHELVQEVARLARAASLTPAP